MKKIQRQTRIRKKIAHVSDRIRLSVFRSNAYVYAQVIDAAGKTLFGMSEKTLKGHEKNTPVERAKAVGKAIAEMALAKKIDKMAFDKGRFAYHGRIKAIAEGAREGGLQL